MVKIMYTIGFDIGGSSIKAVLRKNNRVILSLVKTLPKNINGLLNVLKNIKDEFESEIKPKKVYKVGVAVAGVLDKKREQMQKSPNIKYLDGKPLKKLFQQKLECQRIKIENDTNCFLLAEKKLGVAKKFKDVFYITIGAGVGGALMIDGKIIYGAHGVAGEVGHMILLNFPGAGYFGELEDLVANKFIKRTLGISADEAFKKANMGDKKSQKALTQLGENLGVGIANIINIIDPEVIIISGGVSGAKKFISQGIKKGIDRFVISQEAKKTKIIFTKLGRYGGALGATLLFEQK